MRIVIALGGNALGNNPKEQQSLIKKAVKNIVPLIKEGHEIIISHGNGPQVGVINLAFEDSYQNEDIPYMPFPECTAMSQGYIGYHIQKGLRDVLEDEGIEKSIVTLVTQVVVDRYDPSFKNPTKPVGPFYSKRLAEKMMETTGEMYVEDAGRGYRKVVASPKPLEIVEIDTIRTLVEKGSIVIAAGGGGIPIFKQNEAKGANAVVDKDAASSLMAVNLNADMLVILTNVEQAELFYGTENAQKLGEISVEDAKGYITAGHFAKGSMLPKVQAAVDFVEKTHHQAIITSLTNLSNAIQGIRATIIKN
ncbi:MAG TPA: carbamate kinase [Candidatus Scybalousia intestinigallinarum]|nr:carbamate kinase [Candidatus Scybalousia intestinigallinarum]